MTKDSSAPTSITQFCGNLMLQAASPDNADPNRPYKLQLSIGVTPSSAATDTIEELLALADRRMYEQKRASKLG